MLTLAAVLTIALAGCASTSPATNQPANPVTEAVEQPFRDLNVVHKTTAEVVARAAQAPYVDNGMSCEDIADEIAALNKVLGPDVDSPLFGARTPLLPDAVIGSLLAGAVRLPFRGVVREVTGAEARDRKLRDEVVAATSRRGFLRGLAIARDCNSPPAVAAAPAESPTPSQSDAGLKPDGP